MRGVDARAEVGSQFPEVFVPIREEGDEKKKSKGGSQRSARAEGEEEEKGWGLKEEDENKATLV